MAEKDRFTISRERAASSIRSKITGFDFADSAKASKAIVNTLGEVAARIGDKSELQSAQFDKLLKVLEFLPKDFLEQRKQQKEIFITMAKLTASVERQAKAEPNLIKKFDLRAEARRLRNEGSSLLETDKPRTVKEAFAQKYLKIGPQALREGGSIAGAMWNRSKQRTRDRSPVLAAMFDAVNPFKKTGGFDKQVDLENRYPEVSKDIESATEEARKKGSIRKFSNITGITRSQSRSGDGSGRGSAFGGPSYGPILRQMTTTLIEIRDAITGKGRAPTPPTEGVEPKSLLTPEQKDLLDPKNWGIKKKGKQKGRKFWNKRNSTTGRIMKPGEVEPEIPDTPSDITEQSLKFDQWRDAKKAAETGHVEPSTTSGSVERATEEKSLSNKALKTNDKGELEVQLDPNEPETHKRFEASGIEKEEPATGGAEVSSEGGGVLGGLGGALGIGAAIMSALPEILPAILGIAIPLILTAGVLGLIYEFIKHAPDKVQAAAGVPITGSKVPDAHPDEGLTNPARGLGQYITEESVQNTNKTNLALEESEKRAKVDTWKELLEKNAANGSIASKRLLDKWNLDHKIYGPARKSKIATDTKPSDGINIPASTTGAAIEQQLPDSTVPTVIAPVTNNITNNSGGGGKGSTDQSGMPSVRTLDPSFTRWQDKRQSRTF